MRLFPDNLSTDEDQYQYNMRKMESNTNINRNESLIKTIIETKQFVAKQKLNNMI